MIKIYGSPRGSAGRCYWMLEECGLTYEVMPMDMSKKDHKNPDYMKLNPNGKVPTLVDNSFVIWESIAINRYLAEKYKPSLLGTSIEERALVDQWSVWGMTEFQPPMVDLLIQMVFVPEARRDPKIIEKSKERIPEKLKILNEALTGKDFIVGKEFLLTDLNLASIANIGLSLGYDYREFGHLSRWLEKLRSRPAFIKLQS